jgi:hypothetical protein
MYCPTCGAQIPDDSVFCRNCGAPIPGRRVPDGLFEEAPAAPVKTTPAIFKNLLNTLKAFFSKKPDEGVHVAGESNTLEWTMLIGTNILIFAFAYAINLRQIFSAALSSLIGSDLGSMGSYLLGSAVFNFGFHLLFGFLIGIFLNAVVFGAYFLLEKVIHRSERGLMNILNTVAYSTIPLTLIFVLNMLLGLIWGYLVIPFTLIAMLAQAMILHTALRKNAKNGRVSFLIFIGVCFVALSLILLIGYLFFRAGVSASGSVAVGRLGSYFGF